MSNQLSLESPPTAPQLHLRTQTPLVSIVTLCYNHTAYVIKALESVRSQDYKNIQWIIVDDCSSDNTVHLIKDWIEKYQISCHFIVHKSNQGVIKTLNEAISLTKGKYIALIPGDDIWVPGKLAYQVNQMEQLPEKVGVLYSDSYKIDHHGNLLDHRFIETYRKFSSPPTGDIFLDLIKGNFIPGSTLLIRRCCFDKVGLFDENLHYEDWDMWLRIACHYDFFFSEQVSAYYRIALNSLSHVLFSSKNVKAISTDFKMYLKYCHHPKIQGSDKEYLENRIICLAYELNILKYRKRRSCLYKALRYKFGKETFVIWLCACFGLSQSFGHQLYAYLVKLKQKLKGLKP